MVQTGEEYFPIEAKINLSSLKEQEDFYLDNGEYFNDTDYNETTLISLIDNRVNSDKIPDDYREYTYSRRGILPNPSFIPEEWEVVKLVVSVETLGEQHVKNSICSS